MFALLRFVFFCVLAIAAGVFAVSIPVAGHTPAEHVRLLVHRVSGMAATATPATPAAPAPRTASRKPAAAAPVLARKPAPRPPADDPTPEERAALDELIGQRTR